MAHLLLGVIVAAATAAGLLLAGQSLWIAFLAYCATGALTVASSAAVFVLRQRPAARPQATAGWQAQRS